MKSAERFALVALEVRGIRMLDGTDVLDASGLTVGDNIFAVDVDSVAARLESLVWVRTARVERKPPDRLIIWVDERVRDAWLDTGEGMFGVDEDGVLLPQQALPSETPRDLDLPVIRDLAVGEPEVTSEVSEKHTAGDIVADATLAAILTWWRQAREHDASFSGQISELRPLGTDGLRVILGGDGLEVRLPLQGNKLGQHLQTLNKVLPTVYGDVANPGYVDLRFTDQLVVGSAQAAARHRIQPRSKPQVRPELPQASVNSRRAQVDPSRVRGDHRG